MLLCLMGEGGILHPVLDRGGSPSSSGHGGTPSSPGQGGTPFSPGWEGGTPSSLYWGGVPHLVLARGFPIQFWPWRYPIRSWPGGTVCLLRSRRRTFLFSEILLHFQVKRRISRVQPIHVKTEGYVKQSVQTMNVNVQPSTEAKTVNRIWVSTKN